MEKINTPNPATASCERSVTHSIVVKGSGLSPLRKEESWLVYKKRISFNCINSTEYLSKSCMSPIQCKVPGCGKSHHMLLHQQSPTRGNADHQTSYIEITVIPAITTPLPSIQDAPSSTCATSTVPESSEISLQISPSGLLAMMEDIRLLTA